MEKLLEALKTQEKLVEKEKECLGRSEDLGVFCWVLGCCDVHVPGGQRVPFCQATC